MWEMQILVGAKIIPGVHSYYPKEAEGGEWMSLQLQLPVVSPPTPRYDHRDDAVAMLDKLYPDLPACCKRVVRV